MYRGGDADDRRRRLGPRGSPLRRERKYSSSVFFNVAIFSWMNCALFAPPPAGAAGGEENKRGELPFFFVSRFERKPWLTNRQSRA